MVWQPRMCLSFETMLSSILGLVVATTEIPLVWLRYLKFYKAWILSIMTGP
jgi:low affinity Fe/Cu permease